MSGAFKTLKPRVHRAMDLNARLCASILGRFTLVSRQKLITSHGQAKLSAGRDRMPFAFSHARPWISSMANRIRVSSSLAHRKSGASNRERRQRTAQENAPKGAMCAFPKEALVIGNTGGLLNFQIESMAMI